MTGAITFCERLLAVTDDVDRLEGNMCGEQMRLGGRIRQLTETLQTADESEQPDLRRDVEAAITQSSNAADIVSVLREVRRIRSRVRGMLHDLKGETDVDAMEVGGPVAADVTGTMA